MRPFLIADSAVRSTQGTQNAEDISRFETGQPFIRAFTQFYNYFNMQANLLGTEVAVTMRELGLKKGMGRMMYIYLMGFMLPAVASELIVRIMSGDFDEDDDDQYLDDAISGFFNGQVRTATAFFPVVGPVTQASINAFNDKWYDDRISTAPSIALLTSAAQAPGSITKAVFDDGSKKKAIRDTLTAIGLLSGLPAGAVSRPISYLTDVAEGNAEPGGVIDFGRGLVTGKPGN